MILVLYSENPEDSTQELAELVDKFSMVAGCVLRRTLFGKSMGSNTES